MPVVTKACHWWLVKCCDLVIGRYKSVVIKKMLTFKYKRYQDLWASTLQSKYLLFFSAGQGNIVREKNNS
jgi:hypothetical protein